MSSYVETRDGGYWIAGKRISLDSIVYAFRRGQTPESIRSSFPLLTLEEVYGAIAYYLANEHEIDQYLVTEDAEFEKFQRSERDSDDWYLRMQKAREELLTPQI